MGDQSFGRGLMEYIGFTVNNQWEILVVLFW